MIIPRDIQLFIEGKTTKVANFMNSEDDSTVIVQQGQLMQGIMSKSIMGDGAGGLIHTIWLDLGSDVCCKFMT